MSINLPIRSRRSVIVLSAPGEDRFVGLTQQVVGSDVRRMRGQSGRGRRQDYGAITNQHGRRLDAAFDIDLIVQIYRDMSASAGDLIRAYEVPNPTAGVRNDFRQVG